jgi:tRNA-2-methylthio-N6-dimethylallyladenosine synthase
MESGNPSTLTPVLSLDRAVEEGQMPDSLRSYHIITYGCQMNDNDTEIMAGILQARGLKRVPEPAEADVILVNTCVVREGAEDRAVNKMQNFAALKRQKPHLILGVTGCMAQRDGHAVLERLPYADMVIGTRDLFKVGSLVQQVSRTGERVVAVEDVDKPVFLGAEPVQRKHALKGLCTIMYGCNNFCSFCIVPMTRGRETSRPLPDIVDEVTRMVGTGFREVQLLGQNVNSYRDRKNDFADLLTAVNGIPGLERIRFITSHPKDCCPKLIEAVANLPKVCTNLHLPVQSGSNRVLRRMKRFYTREHYLDLVRRCREQIPDCSISTDIIIGFCDETEEDFLDTHELIREARFDSAFIFMYSPRVGTKSAQWHDSVSIEDKKRRLARALALQESVSGEIHQSLVGSIQTVLVEGLSRKSPHDVIGRTMADRCIVFPGGEDLIGRTMDVRVTEGYSHTLFGRPVSND